MRDHVARLFALLVAALVTMVMLVNSAQAAPAADCPEGLCDKQVEFTAGDDFEDESNPIDKKFSKFVRIGRGHAFVRIGKSTGLDNDFDEQEKRASRFMRIGKAANRFMRIGKSVDGDDKRASRFMRIGKSLDDEDMMDKRGHAFVRIGKIPSSAFVRIGREPLLDRLMKKPSSSFLRIGRMGQSSFVRIGKKSSGPESDSQEDSFSV